MRRGITSTLATATAVAAISLGIGTTSASAAPATISCPYGHFCGQDDSGDRFDVYKCGVKTPIGLSGLGEFFNNQTPNTIATWYDSAGNPRGGSTSGVSGYIDWTNIWFVKAC